MEREKEREGGGSDVYQVDFSVREKEGLASGDVWGGSATRGILTAGTADSWLAHDDDDVDGDGDVCFAGKGHCCGVVVVVVVKGVLSYRVSMQQEGWF